MRERLKGHDGSPHPYKGEGGVQADRYGKSDKIRHCYRMWAAISLNYVKIVPQICTALIKDNYAVSSSATYNTADIERFGNQQFSKEMNGSILIPACIENKHALRTF